jgi:hypothetical protein
MSCPSSVQALPHDYDPALLAEAMVTVAERSFFAYAEVSGPECVEVASGGWYEAAVSFRGPFSGRVLLALPSSLARDLSMSFLGLEPDAVLADPSVADLVGEISNMVCGSWLTGLPETACFELTHPEVRTIDAAPDDGMVVAVNDQPVVLHLEIAPGQQ